MRFIKTLSVVALLTFSVGVHAELKIQHWTSPSGAKVLFVEDRSIPMLDISVDFAAGGAYVAREKSGLAGLTQSSLALGAADMDEQAISNRYADIGAQAGGRSDSDRVGFTLRTLVSEPEFSQALATLAAVLQQPVFPAEPMAREKMRTIAALKDAETKPEVIADRAFYAAMYGNHPYANMATAATVSTIARDDIIGFYRRYYRASRAVVSILGAVSRADAEKIAEQLTAGLSGGGDADKDTIPEIPPVTLPARAESIRIPHPATQSHVLMGLPATRRGDPDFFTLQVGNYILGGGGFVSRLMHEVREKRGYAYSVYSYFGPMRELGPFQLGLQTQKEQTDAALQVVRATLEEFLRNGPTPQELLAAKQNLIGGFPLRIDSNRKIIEFIAAIGFYNLPQDYIDTYTANLERVSIADIRRAFASRLLLDRMPVVVVGASSAK